MMNAKDYYSKLEGFVKKIREITDFVPETALVLGSGLGDFAENIRMIATVDYSSLEGFPISTAPGHVGRFIFGELEGKKIIAMQGRVHYYEGYDMGDVVLPARLMHMLGAKTIILTNAAGGINPEYKAGDFMVLKDHISDFVPSPLRGENIDELGVRFPDMTNVYDVELRKTIKKVAERLSVPVHEGVYVQTPGPNYETPAEIRMFSMLGADAVGMSTACEATAARHCGMKVCAISCISNLAAGISKAPLSHKEVQETANRVSKQFEQLIKEIIKEI